MCQPGCRRLLGNRPDAVHCKLPLLTASLEPSGIPSSHCSAFVYRKPDENEIGIGTPGTKFPLGTKCSSVSPFPLGFSGSRHHSLIVPALQLWDSGVLRNVNGQMLQTFLCVSPSGDGSLRSKSDVTQCLEWVRI